MATRIPASIFKRITGLTYKKEGVYLAKKFGVRPARKKTNVTVINFLKRLRRVIREHDYESKYNHVVDKIINKINDGSANMDKLINLKQINKLHRITSIINGKKYSREVPEIYISPMMVATIAKYIPEKKGFNLVMEITENVIHQDMDGNEEIKTRTVYATINEFSLSYLENQSEWDEVTMTDSWGWYTTDSRNIINVGFHYIPKSKCNNVLQGGYFKYHIIKDEFNDILIKQLERYQIYTKCDYSKINEDENCLIHALKLAGVDCKLLMSLQLKCKSSNIPLSELKKFIEDNNLCINVSGVSKNTGEIKNYKYGNCSKKEDIIQICLLENHFFVNEKVNISKFSIENYEEVKRFEDWWRISERNKKGNKIYFKRGKYSNNSLNLIKSLLKSNLLTEIKLSEESIALNSIKHVNIENIMLDNNPSEYKIIESNKYDKTVSSKTSEILKSGLNKKISNNFIEVNDNRRLIYLKKDIKIAFDIETTTNMSIHVPYLISYIIYVDDKEISSCSMTGEDCIDKFLKQIKTALIKYISSITTDLYKLKNKSLRREILNLFNITMLAHNITYDIQFLVKHVQKYNPIYRAGNKICGGSFKYYDFKFNIKDTYAMIDSKLADFSSMFNLDYGKEIFPYGLYTQDSVQKTIMPISEAIRFLKEEDVEGFKQNLDSLNLKVGKDNFGHMLYAKYYCMRDVKVMMEGYFTFKQWVKDQLGLNIDNYLTISALSNAYFIKEQCYDNCYKLNGIARYYIQKSVVGGRCMSNSNKKYITHEKLNDFDGVSLYPSAMKRLSEIGGYLQGTPKVIETKDLNMDFLNKQDGYFIRIRLNNLRIDRDFPLCSYVNNKNVRTFTNKFNYENNIMYVNKISLEDIIEFHGIMPNDFEIIDGYYFNEGRNNKIGEVIQKIFNLRIDFKNKKNPIQNLFKLIMNSSYGKTIMKERPYEINFIDSSEELNKQVTRHYNNIINYEKIDGCDKYIMKRQKPIIDHYNSCQIGSEILAMSKRIMNEVMCLAEDNDIKIYYQDTDSMHIENDKIEILSKMFKKRYGRELVGKNLGQFHCDFIPINNSQAIYSIKTIILGKKSYYDKVMHDNGTFSEHYRMKGITKSAVDLMSKEKFCDKLDKLYEFLYDGNSLEFDLLAGGKPKFKLRTGCISNLTTFKRTVSFVDDMEDDENLAEYSDELIDSFFEEIDEHKV